MNNKVKKLSIELMKTITDKRIPKDLQIKIVTIIKEMSELANDNRGIKRKK